MTTITLILFAINILQAVSFACNPRDLGKGATVCVCSKSDCDTIPPVKRLHTGYFEMYTSSMAGSRFARSSGRMANNYSINDTSATISINRKTKFQKIYGFGGAFTDSSGINILSLSNETQRTLMNAYFSDNGVQYSLGSIPMGGTDFSTNHLKNFNLQLEDTDYKIPLILQAMYLTNNDFKLYASSSTAPAWMKTSTRFATTGFLNLTMYDVWADYYIKFLDAYRAHGINMWGLTTTNKLDNGFTEFMMGQWIAQNLGPKIRQSKYYSDLKIIIVDDQSVYFPWIPPYILQNEDANNYVDGLGVHYSSDKYVSADVLSEIHFTFPDKFILSTEASEGSLVEKADILGTWDRAENYIYRIIDDLNNWSTGWVDWNIAINTEGGPTYRSNYYYYSPIIINKTSDEFYKQPMYYGLGHFSKFLRPDSVRLQSTSPNSVLKHVVFERPDGGTVVSILNPTDNDLSVIVSDMSLGNNYELSLNISKKSINTILYW